MRRTGRKRNRNAGRFATRPWSASALLLVLVAWTAAVAAEDGAAQAAGTLFQARWRAGAFGRIAEGWLCWLSGDDHLWRAEILLDEGTGLDATTGLDRLLARHGDGWTVSSAGPGAATLTPWADEWRRLEAGLALRAELVLALLDAGPGGIAAACRPPVTLLPDRRPLAGRPRWWRQNRDGPATGRARLLLPAPTDGRAGEGPRGGGGDWRRSAVARGRGRGGPGEIWAVRWQQRPSEGSGPGLRLTSSRRLGRLEIAVVGSSAVAYPLPETFLPLWPLQELITREP